jgi:tripartite-type tricarboxylate transporter receptor subunit TctC
MLSARAAARNASCSANRVAELPDVPTPIEVGLVDADSATRIGVFMPAKTPRDIIDKFHAAGVKVLTDPATQERLRKMGVEAAPMSPAQMDDLVKHHIAANGAVVKAAGRTERQLRKAGSLAK